MAEMPWHVAVELARPHVVRILTPDSAGTGFLVSSAPATGLVVIATAAHVVSHAHSWEELIRIEHDGSKPRVLHQGDRAIFLDESRDAAAIVFSKQDLALPDTPLPLAPKGRFLKVGNDIGWLGFPAVASTTMCFFGGTISAWLTDQKTYLVDGVAINGVSGGPALVVEGQTAVLIGLVSAYVPNRATGEVLPGLAVVRDVSPFHEMAPAFASLGQAQSQQAPAQTTEPPPNPPPDALLDPPAPPPDATA